MMHDGNPPRGLLRLSQAVIKRTTTEAHGLPIVQFGVQVDEAGVWYFRVIMFDEDTDDIYEFDIPVYRVGDDPIDTPAFVEACSYIVNALVSEWAKRK